MEEDELGIVYAPHWYDVLTLLTKKYTPLAAVDEQTGKVVVGAGRIRKSFAAQMAQFKTDAAQRFAGIPTLIGEFGIPFDLDDKEAYHSGDFSKQEQALERSFRAVEDNLLSCTLWNYTPDNTNSRGDLWNDEDFSIFCRDQQVNPGDLNSGGRALASRGATVRQQESPASRWRCPSTRGARSSGWYSGTTRRSASRARSSCPICSTLLAWWWKCRMGAGSTRRRAAGVNLCAHKHAGDAYGDNLPPTAVTVLASPLQNPRSSAECHAAGQLRQQPGRGLRSRHP